MTKVLSGGNGWGAICILKGKKVCFSKNKIRNQDSISYMYKNKLRYSIYESDTSYILSGRKKIKQKINFFKENFFEHI